LLTNVENKIYLIGAYDKLPNEIFFEIFQFLPLEKDPFLNVLLAKKRFYEIISNKIFWSEKMKQYSYLTNEELKKIENPKDFVIKIYKSEKDFFPRSPMAHGSLKENRLYSTPSHLSILSEEDFPLTDDDLIDYVIEDKELYD
jgi:hypothetical protein